MPVVEVSLTLSFLYKEKTFPHQYRSYIPLSHIYHTYVLLNAERICIAKCFSSGNLFMLIIF